MNPEFFSFELADSIQVALPLTHVEKIIQIPHQQICPLPGIAFYWAGIFNDQGSLLWILDSELFFNLVPSGSQKKANLTAIVVTLQIPETQRRIAISVKRLKGLLTLDHNTSSLSLFPLLPQFQTLFSSFIFNENEILLVLEIEHFFNNLSRTNLSLIDV